jgi:hypothetical protein
MFVTASNVRTGLSIDKAFEFLPVLHDTHITTRKLRTAVNDLPETRVAGTTAALWITPAR